jgi:WD40 repeat protein
MMIRVLAAAAALGWLALGVRAAGSEPAGAQKESPQAAPSAALPVYSAAPVITALAFSPDGSLLAVSGNREVVLHRGDGSGAVARLVGRAERIHSIDFSPDGKLLLAAGGSPARFGEVQLWDVSERRLVKSSRVGADTLFGATFSPDGRFVSIGCPDKTIRVLDASTLDEVKRVEAHQDWVFATVFSVDSRRVVSVSRDHFLKMSEVATGMFIENLNLLTKATFGGQGELYALARHPKKDVVVDGGDDRTPRLYTMHRPRAIKIDDDSCLLREFEAQPGPVQALRFSADGSQVAVAGNSEVVHVYGTDTGARKAELRGHKGAIYALAFRPDGTLAAGGFDGTVRLYDVAAQSLRRAFVPVPIAEGAASGAKSQ